MEPSRIRSEAGEYRRKADALLHLAELIEAGFPEEILRRARDAADHGKLVLARFDPGLTLTEESACMQGNPRGGWVSWSEVCRLFGSRREEEKRTNISQR
jgi:hypothetical protein